MTDRLRRLNEALQIAIRHHNAVIADSIRDAIRAEEANPQYLQTSSPSDAET